MASTRGSGVRIDNRSETHVDNRGATFQNQGDVYNAPITHQTVIKDNSRAVTYEVDKEDVDTLEWWSKFLIGRIGERRTKLTTLISGLLGILSTLSSIYKVPELPTAAAVYPIYAAFVFFLVAVGFGAALRYRIDSRCVKCNTFYAMKEIGEPVQRDVKVKGGIRRTTTRLYKCAKCSATMPKKSNEFIADEPEEE